MDVGEEWFMAIEKCIRKRHMNGRRARKCIQETASRYVQQKVREGVDYREAWYEFFKTMKRMFGDRF